MGVNVIAMTHELNRAMVMTRDKERVYSPATCSAIISGIKNKIVVSEEVRSGTVNSLPHCLIASSRSTFFSIRLMISSATTIPLSTSKPREMMREARLILSNLISKIFIRARDTIITMGTNAPTIEPVLKPRNIITVARTMIRVCATLRETPSIVLLTTSAW